MEDLGLVERMVRTLAAGLSVPVTVKIRRFTDLQQASAAGRPAGRRPTASPFLPPLTLLLSPTPVFVRLP